MIKDHLLRPDTIFQRDRLKTERLVPCTKRRTDRRQNFNRKWIWDGERPKCEKNELGFVYVIKDYFLRPDTNFQHNRLKTVELVPATKCVADHLVNYQSEVDLGR